MTQIRTLEKISKTVSKLNNDEFNFVLDIIETERNIELTFKAKEKMSGETK